LRVFVKNCGQIAADDCCWQPTGSRQYLIR